jgi:2-C-methyl-D-erythritol 4-phosphate cytidylyltransferase
VNESVTVSVAVIITAAGSSRRFGRPHGSVHGGDKLAVKLGESSVLAMSIAAFVDLPGVTEIVVAISPSLATDSELGREIAAIRHSTIGHRARFVPAGGASRANTVSNALHMLAKPSEFVAIHDGARPLVSKELTARVIDAAVEHGAAAPAVPVTSTIKLAGSTLPSRVERTVPRSTLWAMQTPQVMRRAMLLDAIARCPIPLDEVTDDVQLLELVGHPVMLVAGDERNLKITTATDLHLARLLSS